MTSDRSLRLVCAKRLLGHTLASLCGSREWIDEDSGLVNNISIESGDGSEVIDCASTPTGGSSMAGDSGSMSVDEVSMPSSIASTTGDSLSIANDNASLAKSTLSIESDGGSAGSNIDSTLADTLSFENGNASTLVDNASTLIDSVSMVEARGIYDKCGETLQNTGLPTMGAHGPPATCEKGAAFESNTQPQNTIQT
jgi:hypothetical protein